MEAREYAKRRKAYRAVMGGEELDGILVTNLPDVRYICGFSGSSGMALLLRERGYFLTDFRYREQSSLEVCGLKTVVYNTGPEEGVAGILRGRAGSRLGFDGTYLSYAGVLALRRQLRGCASLVPLKGSLTLLRARKSRAELDIIRNNIRLAETAFKKALGDMTGETRAVDLAAAVDIEARRMGAEGPSFETIVASGPRGALVHAQPSRRRLRGATVIDWGVVKDGYCTDTTRTLAFGKVSPELRKTHRNLLDAQQRALEKTRPGVKARDIDSAAREAIERAGYGDAFGHGLGHGVGLEVHEQPYEGKNSHEVIEEGMVFTNEPGIYLPGTGGARIEDMVLVTYDGAELLTRLPRGLDPDDYL